MPRCEIAVPARQYGEPGRCLKVKNVIAIQVLGVKTKVCRHHRAMIEGGKKIVRAGR